MTTATSDRNGMFVEWRTRPLARRCLAVAILLLLMSVATARDAAAAVIFVTTPEQKISSTGGCSLQEAIYSANFDLNVAIAGYSSDTHTPHVITTQCVPGNGNDIIVLPTFAVMHLNRPVDDADNPMGPTATPMITSNITILANGATLDYLPACSAGYSDIPCPSPFLTYTFRAFAVASNGHLTLRNAYVRGFLAQGGSGSDGGGGGLGAGGAIHVQGGGLVIENSTFQANGAVGGNGGGKGHGLTGGGGGGGLGGNGGLAGTDTNDFGEFLDSGGGGGGSRGDGFRGQFGPRRGSAGGGGGTVFGATFRTGGFDCGGDGGAGEGSGVFGGTGDAGANGACPGGGGGGGGWGTFGSGDGGSGDYGGGGGGGAQGGGNGGDGGFGGGGGAGWAGAFGGTRGGEGGFGGGGGAAADGYIFGGGDPATGGKFGGDANARNGGGGGGLGGAIFNDSGSVVVRNSTFTGNFVTRGLGGGAGTPSAADNGADAGGAIFSRNGRLTVQNATISGNESTGFGGGVVVVQDSASAPTLFVLENTIIANNGGQGQCSIDGFVIAGTFAGNLIQSNDNCQGVVTSGDPLLGPLQYNTGFTPTMAIPQTSAAFNAAASGLATDQRGADRPEMGGFDIGAFELCLDPLFGFPCIIDAGVSDPDTVQLTIQVSPTAGGVTTPAAGTYNEPVSVVPLTATPNAGYMFAGWSPNVAAPANASTTVVMNQNQVVTAFFSPGPTSLGGNILTKSGRQSARVWPVSVANAGPGVALAAQISTFTLTQTFGAACTPVLLTVLPAPAGDLAPGGSAVVNLTFDFTGCAATARFTAQATFSANSGAATGSMIRTNQFQ